MIHEIYSSEDILKKYKEIFENNKGDNDFNSFLKDNSYDIIKNSNTFDEAFYIENYPDTAELNLDSIQHYLKYGVFENYNPNSFFNTKEYFENHHHELNGLNPFVHYLVYHEGNISSKISSEIHKNIVSPDTFSNIMRAFDKEISIIILIFNDYDDAKKCIESVLEHTSVKFNLILIDNNSTDSHILDQYEIFPNIEIIRNEVNKGFTENINLCINSTDNDVILLNSDTIVSPGWIQKILISAYSDKDIGTLTPISNASDISVPIMNQNNEIPSFLNVDTMALLIEKVSLNGNLVAPKGNSFCLFIKRETIDDVGLFDEENFDKGYGEETDFTMRAKSKGWKNVINDSIFIYHKESASFSLSKANDLKEKYDSILLSRYPNMFVEWNEFVNSDKLLNSIENINNCINNFDENFIKPNILYITSLENDIPKIDNVKELSKNFNLFILTIKESNFKLWFVNNDKFLFIEDLKFNSKYPNLIKLNSFYLSLFQSLTINSLFIQFNNSFKFLSNSPYITPVMLASKLGMTIRYGNSSFELENPLIKFKSNKDILLNNVFGEKERGVVYTAIFGDYEDLLDPKVINPNWDYICFTDNPKLTSDIWEIRIIDNLEWDDIRNARAVKILPHKFLKEYDYSIWVDAGFQIIGDISDFIIKYSTGKSMLCSIHTDRDCVYDEAIACINAKKDDKQIIQNQINKYKKESFPKNFGLIETGVLFRKHHNNDLIKVMEDWYSEVINFSKRDQLSLPYVLWKNNFEIDKCREFNWKNSYFEHFFHQNFDSNDKIHIFIINDDNAGTKNSINSLRLLSSSIPISIINSTNETFQNENISNYLKFEEINSKLKNIKENFLIFLHSGDLITEELLNFISLVNSNEISNVGAVVFDSTSRNSSNLLDNFKPNFSPDLYLEHDYIKNSVIFNKNPLLSVGSFNINFKNNFIRDAIMRLYDYDFDILKEDIVGFKLNSNIENSNIENKSWLENTLSRKNINAKIDENLIKPIYNNFNKKASIIIPFKDKSDVTEKCILSILNKTNYTNFEIILVNNNSYDLETFDFMKKYINHEKIKIINFTDAFNYSKLNNYATKFASGDVFVFLNNDTEVISENWLSLLVGDAIQENIGAVGAKLYYSDNSIQHTGVVIGLNGLAGHLFNGENDDDIPDQILKFRRNFSGVTGACMAIQREVFDEINGFDELFDITGNDVEICLRLMQHGYRNILNPAVKLIHHEETTRSKIRVRDIDIKLSVEYYGPYLDKGDPFFNKNFSLNSNILKIKENDEIPIFEDFLKNYYHKKSIKNNKLNNLKTHTNNVNFDAEVIKYDVTQKEIDDNAILMNNFLKNPSLELNTIVWFVPQFDLILRGGIYTIFRIANYFSETENTRNIIVLKGYKKRNIKDTENEIRNTFPNLIFNVIDLDVLKDVSKLPPSDAAFCTYWTTAYSLVKYNKCKAKFYLNQDYEPLFKAAGSVYGLIEQTYRFNFIGLANSKGVYDKYKSYGNIVEYFTPAVDKNIYFPGSSEDSKKRVVFYGRPNEPRNGFILGIEALKIVKAYFGDSVEIFSVGAEFDLNEYDLDGIITNLGRLDSFEEVANLYRKCDVGLVFMFTPHPSYQPLEYMACGCATVTNINENNIWLLKDKENAILSEPVISCVAENIINLLNDDKLRKNIIHNGFRTIENLDWDEQLKNIAEFVKNPISPMSNVLEDHGYSANEIHRFKNEKEILNLYFEKKLLKAQNNYLELEKKINNLSEFFVDDKLNFFKKMDIFMKLIEKDYSSLKISIKTPNPSTQREWGDYFFAEDLKESLQKIGFDVKIYDRDFWYEDNSDIVILLRGLFEYKPNPNQINLMWNIYMPEDLTFEEYEKYDCVFVASEKYANEINEKVSTLVKPLLQCTNPKRFFYEENDEFNDEILFVGRTRGIFRPVVKDLLKTEHDFSVYGKGGWENFIDSKFIKGEFIDNNILNKAYSSCKILLNDHREDMKEKNFISNRIFDALACRTFVISDELDEINYLFEGNVVTYTDYKDLNKKLNYYLENEDERINMAKRGQEIVLKNHTFDIRSQEIISVLEKECFYQFIEDFNNYLNSSDFNENLNINKN